jgi:hypothetical protein
MGTLAGSTIMLLTIVWGGSVLCGRCDLDEQVGVLRQDCLAKGPMMSTNCSIKLLRNVVHCQLQWTAMQSSWIQIFCIAQEKSCNLFATMLRP